jgi:hypothetical protein
MHFQFLLSDPHGDIEPSREDLDQPFLISPEEQHPFLTLADYFEALQEFITRADGNLLRSALEKQNPQDTNNLADISEVLIRSEKHGAFYHIASIELVGLETQIKFALTTALSESAKASLNEEFAILQQLAELNPDFIPEVYCRESVTWKTDSGSETFLMVLGQWLEGYHEWHLGDDPDTGDRKIQLWDYANGYRFLSDAESYALLCQSATILTCYYNQASFRQIYPWHHGAGDFIVNAESGAISVKLITTRQYEALVHFDQAEEADRLIAAIHFLLNLSLRMRLDRLDGIFEPAWFEEFAVHAAIEGFFAGLITTQAEGELLIGPVRDFLEILQSFDSQEILDMYGSLLEIYADEDQDDFRLIQEKLPDHAVELYEALQGFSLEKSR